MTKQFCVGGIALVAILGLVGLSLTYSSAAPVPDEEAAKLVGDLPACKVQVNARCIVDPCSESCYCTGSPSPSGVYFQAALYCGPDTTNCVELFLSPKNCIVATTVTAAPNP